MGHINTWIPGFFSQVKELRQSSGVMALLNELQNIEVSTITSTLWEERGEMNTMSLRLTDVIANVPNALYFRWVDEQQTFLDIYRLLADVWSTLHQLDENQKTQLQWALSENLLHYEQYRPDFIKRWSDLSFSQAFWTEKRETNLSPLLKNNTI